MIQHRTRRNILISTQVVMIGGMLIQVALADVCGDPGYEDCPTARCPTRWSSTTTRCSTRSTRPGCSRSPPASSATRRTAGRRRRNRRTRPLLAASERPRTAEIRHSHPLLLLLVDLR